MHGHAHDKSAAHRPLPSGFLRRTQPPREPRHDESTTQTAQVNAEAFGQNAHLSTALPVLPPRGHPGATLQRDVHPPRPPISPPQQAKFDHQSSSLAKHNQSAYFQNSALEQLHVPLGRSEIRLIRIPPQTSGPLRLTFMHASLGLLPPYIALSYTWGDGRDKVSIELNGHTRYVTRNLYDALRNLQSHDRDILCWADSICINQDDQSEVTKQVMMMGSIYSFASSVAVWLGPASTGSIEAIELLEKIAKNDTVRNDGTVRDMIQSPRNQEAIKAIIDLFERDYWRRVWVVQEVLNAKWVTIHCGKSTLPWRTYQRAADVFKRNSIYVDQCFSSWSQTKGLPPCLSTKLRLPYSQIFSDFGPSSFAEVKQFQDTGSETGPEASSARLYGTLCACRSKLATDPKDKIYGLLGVLPKGVQDQIIPDYTKTVQEIYTEVAKYIISTSKDLNVVCHAFHFPVQASTSTTGLPSWVPDWSQSPSLTPVSWPSGRFSAGSDKSEDITISDDGVLGISAIFIDEIQYCGTAMNTVNNNHELVVAFLHWFAILQQRMKGFHGLTAEGVEEMENRFCSAIAFDNVHPMVTMPGTWRNVTFHAFASMATELLPEMPLHHRLAKYVDDETLKDTGISRDILFQEIFSKGMIGRSFFLTRNGIMGLGSGFLAVGDAVVVPFGCSTPILLRPDGEGGQYRFVGDAFVDGFMYGRAVSIWREGRCDVVRYDIH